MSVKIIYFWCTNIILVNRKVGENIIATTKIRNNYVAIHSFIFPIIALPTIAIAIVVALKGDSEKITVSFR